MALANVPHHSGRINSGDVSIFYRRFGAKGRTPILIMHGANYFDSYDWIGVAGALAADREVIAFDRRGWGESSWSPSKDYSVDAHVGDAVAVASQMGWDRVIIMGHSASGRVVVAMGSHFPDKVASVVVVDPLLAGEPPGGGAGGGRRQTVGNPPTMFESIDAAMASFAKLSNPPRVAHDRARAENALIRLDSGFMLKRDPDNGNTTPIGEGASLPQHPRSDVWKDMSQIKAPTMIVRGLKSDRMNDPKVLARLTSDYPKFSIMTVDSQHDVADQAPDALIAHVRKFVETS
jgi:pimeloyl-ACP methyl ester carboxylesterase